MEIWKDIPDYENLYQASSKGNIRSVDRYVYTIKGCGKRLVKGKIKTLRPTRGRYLKVTLYKEGTSKTIQVQRVIAKTFIPNPNNKQQVNHIDGNPRNNNIENLEWVTPRENDIHKINVLKKGIKPVMQYDLSGNYIATYESAVKAEEATHVARCSISNVLCGRRNKAGGYVWKYAIR